MVAFQREVARAGGGRGTLCVHHLNVRYHTAAVQQAKGLPLIMLIRLSPFPPWVYSNTLFAVSR